MKNNYIFRKVIVIVQFSFPEKIFFLILNISEIIRKLFWFFGNNILPFSILFQNLTFFLNFLWPIFSFAEVSFDVLKEIFDFYFVAIFFQKKIVFAEINFDVFSMVLFWKVVFFEIYFFLKTEEIVFRICCFRGKKFQLEDF